MREITPVSELVANAERIIKRLTPHQAFEMLQNETGILVDLRDIRELARTGKIEGAIHAPRGMLEFWVDPNSPYHKPVFNTDKALILFVLLAGALHLPLKHLWRWGLSVYLI